MLMRMNSSVNWKCFRLTTDYIHSNFNAAKISGNSKFSYNVLHILDRHTITAMISVKRKCTFPKQTTTLNEIK